ncbi:MAG: inorganic phosphate transporter, partial [Cyanobacteria bacterium NC_groundwater_1444_Ag_S-0.65um_54_12]|nr:inorganic phosphate transporter [Cyanobacteria bacterium NC_groundwater_1444_Ag_S-0.65um_54_12]
MLTALIIVAILFVAYANGANDNFKGIATLFGSGQTSYRGALAWGTLTTFAGSLAALALANRLLMLFSGAGIVPDALAGTPAFIAAVALGTASTVLLATYLSLPVSTTHALIGSLVGAGLMLNGDVQLSYLGARFLLPLLVSPLLAIALTVLLYPGLRWLRRRMGITREICICVEGRWVPATLALAPTMSSGEVVPWAPAELPTVELCQCQERYQGAILAINAQTTLNA